MFINFKSYRWRGRKSSGNRFGCYRQLALALLLGAYSFSSFADNSGIAFVWADQESSPSYTPSTNYTLAGNPVTITRSSAGNYNVQLGSIVNFLGGNGGNVQVTSYGNTSNRCKVVFWAGTNVSVVCHDIAGTPSDTRFTLLFNRASAITEDVAYVWANEPLAASYTPSTSFSHGQDPISITRAGVGLYTVVLGSIANNSDGNVQVTAYGSSSDYCNVRNWGGGSVRVACYDNAGSPSDSRFTLLFSRADSEQDNIAYAWANDANAASYTPDTFYSYSPAAPIVITRSGVGVYNVVFNSVTGTYTNIQVTAYGFGNSNSCNVVFWNNSGARVYCYDVAGNLVNSRFTILARGSGVSDSRSEVDVVSSCLAGLGRVDVNIVNSVTATSVYRLEFQGLSAREIKVAFEDWGRIRLTGRPPGNYSVVVKRDGTTILDKVIPINCASSAPPVGTPEVRILNACRSGLGYVLFQMVNPNSIIRPYVIEFQGVPNRSTSAAPYGQAIRATTGRPDGTYDYRIRSGGSTVNRGALTVDCS